MIARALLAACALIALANAVPNDAALVRTDLHEPGGLLPVRLRAGVSSPSSLPQRLNPPVPGRRRASSRAPFSPSRPAVHARVPFGFPAASLPHARPRPVSPPFQVTTGSTIKLAHVTSGVRLHSQDIPYAFGHGSGQQSVTSIPNSDNEGSFWVVHGVGSNDSVPSPLEAGAKVRLQHAGTRRWLHSHQFRSPLSGAQEVSAFGSDLESDDSDVWTLEFADKRHKGPWKQDEPVRCGGPEAER